MINNMLEELKTYKLELEKALVNITMNRIYEIMPVEEFQMLQQQIEAKKQAQKDKDIEYQIRFLLKKVVKRQRRGYNYVLLQTKGVIYEESLQKIKSLLIEKGYTCSLIGRDLITYYMYFIKWFVAS